MQKQVHEIVLTGGPASGKTSSLSYLSEKLSDWGYRVFVVPEVATMMIGAGIPDMHAIIERHQAGDGTYIDIQEQFLLIQRDLRSRFQTMAGFFPDDKCVIIYDRAEMDVASYTDPLSFRELMSRHDLTYHDVRDSYSGVVHLVTTAIGAEELYTTENNAARREGVDEARIADRRTLRAWTGHPKLRIIDNSTDFEDKLRRVLGAFASILGEPEPLEIERKFLLGAVPDLVGLGVHFHAAHIEQTYLLPQGEAEERVRKREADGVVEHYLTEKRRVDARTRFERERIIGEHEYLQHLERRDPSRQPVVKTRYCFPYESTYCELDVFESPVQFAMLEVELTSTDAHVSLPDFLDVEREVTDEPEFTNSMIAKRSE